MGKSALADAFGHHVWATLRVIDACAALDDEQLATSVPGTYGSIIDTLRHTVGADCGYLATLLRDESQRIDEGREAQLEVAQMRELMKLNGPRWDELLARDLDPDEEVVRHRDDGIDSYAPLGVRIAQALHHGTDHRSQICTALTSLGIEPPEIDVWAYAEKDGRVREVQRAS